MNWYVKNVHGERGPYGLADLHEHYKKGTFSPEDLLWVYHHSGWDWVAAKNVVEVASVFSQSEHKDIKEGLVPEWNSPPTHEYLENKIWAVAGGKGGVGKSLLASSLAMGLTMLGRRVVLIDLDLGGSNQSTLLGLQEPPMTLHDFLSGDVAAMNAIIVPTSLPRLDFISGKGGVLGQANIPHVIKKKLISHLRQLDYDHVILDIGAGSAYNELDFFLEADQKILVTTPEPHAIQDAFHFAKRAQLRKISLQFKENINIRTFFKNKEHETFKSTQELVNALKEIAPSCELEITKLLRDFQVSILLNQVMEKKETQDALFLSKTMQEMLSMSTDILGYVYYDRAVRSSMQKLKPFLVEYPKSKAATCIFSILVQKLLMQKGMQKFLKKRGLVKEMKGIDIQNTYHGYRSGIGIYG